MQDQFEFADETNLLSRLTRALIRRPQEVIFLVGSPLSAPLNLKAPGVPGVSGMIEMIREEFLDDPREAAEYAAVISDAGEKSYQAAFKFLQATRGQSVANEIVQNAVLASLKKPLQDRSLAASDLDRLEADVSAWHLNPATKSIGTLAVHYADRFGKALLTTNFDPLIEVAIWLAKGELFRTTLHLDGSLQQTYGSGCHVVHLHGYWLGSDTLHTSRQLVQDRPRLKASLKNLLKNRLLLVSGYGGWDDVFTSTLVEIVQDDSSGTEILWTFFDQEPNPNRQLLESLEPGINRGRVQLYRGIDANAFFPKLEAAWVQLAPSLKKEQLPSNAVEVSPALVESIETAIKEGTLIEGDDEDRPPLVDLCIGREAELERLNETKSQITFLTGIGGQGKSTIASRYFSDARRTAQFDYFIWRDCKEEGERFENQIASIIEALSGGALSGSVLAKQNIRGLIDILLPRLVSGVRALFVFDNADHYVNLESGLFTGSADLFVRAVLNSPAECQIVFTCRPEIAYPDSKVLNMRLEGLGLEATAELFAIRGANAARHDVEAAHNVTSGHAFWLDLLAHEAVRVSPGKTLGDLVEELQSGATALPETTLASIWDHLSGREHILLRAMAETVRPETENEVGDYVSNDMNFNKFSRALKNLKALNLIVVKRTSTGTDLLELHPVVRTFVRNRSSTGERATVIGGIVKVYMRFIGLYKPQLKARPSLSVLQRWSQAAELDLHAGQVERAILTLAEATAAFESSAFVREYVRVVRLLLNSFDWLSHGREYKDFDRIFEAYVTCLCHLEEFAEADQLLDAFGASLERDARYIRYCEMQCTAKWIRGDFGDAIVWGRRGKELLDATQVDTGSNLLHALALAERDGGSPELAIPVFLKGIPIDSVTDPRNVDEDLDGSFYGNIGRCLQKAGQIESALVCYQKSALIIEKDARHEHILNQGYIRLWIGELLLAREEMESGYMFIEGARRKWERASPHRERQVKRVQSELDPVLISEVSQAEVEEFCRNWILGRAQSYSSR